MLGIFDSGSGGLTVLRAIRQRAPQLDVVYFGDITNAPYGNKSVTELLALTQVGIAVLQKAGATHFVSACNSASASFLAGAAGTEHVLEMTRPTARMLRAYAGKSVLLVGTTATVSSRAYDEALLPIVTLTKKAIPELAGAIESGAPKVLIEKIITQSLAEVTGSFEVVLLACTHYPLVQSVFESVSHKQFGSNCKVLDPADAVAEEVVRSFPTTGTGKNTFLISKDSEVFRMHIESIFGRAQYDVRVV